ncbi:MAG: hypothetical protein ACOX0E_00645 [Syntrophomonadaceae bacterium]
MVSCINRSYIIIALIVIIPFSLAFWAANRHIPVMVTYPEENATLYDNDFALDTGRAILEVGTTTYEEVKAIYPDGYMLGMSTIFNTGDHGCLLTFTEKENILTKIHISSTDYYTTRGVKVGDPFSRVEEAYGRNYGTAQIPGNAGHFDAVFGNDNDYSIVFNVRENHVEKIVLQRGINKI